MSRYTALPASNGSPVHPTSSSSGHASSMGFLRSGGAADGPAGTGARYSGRTEMDAAFDGSDDDDDDDDLDLDRDPASADRRGLLDKSNRREESQFRIGGDESDEDENEHEDDTLNNGEYDDPLRNGRRVPQPIVSTVPSQTREEQARMPGSYDFDRDFFLPPAPPQPPSSPPPFFTHWSANPAPDNSNGIIPTSTPAYPPTHPSHLSTRLELLGSLLPSVFHPRSRQTRGSNLGGGHTGVFANLSARPDLPHALPRPGEQEGPEWVPEVEGKDVPPTYEAALRDAVPPYWETTVVLPSSGGPFGTMISSMTGDEILIDGMPVGNLFAFAWNMLVSLSFQFIGFLLTYVLHTTHAAKHGSRAGLGITLIQYGLYLRGRAEQMIKTGHFPIDPNDPSSDPNVDPFEDLETLKQYWAPGFRTPPHWSSDGTVEIPSFKSPEEAKEWEVDHQGLNMTMAEILQMPTAKEVGQANEWLSFILMAGGWFLLLTSLGGYWRVKRFENRLRAAQSTTEDPTSELGNPVDPESNDPRNRAFYTSRATRALRSIREIRTQIGGSLYYLNLPPLARRGHHDDEEENVARRRTAPGPEDEEDGEAFILFSREREMDRDPEMEDGVDIPGVAASQGLTTEEWSRRNLYNG